jgi:hypothetical protein
MIYGQGLKETKRVRFKDDKGISRVDASFVALGAHALQVTVPMASSGLIRVVTPNGVAVTGKFTVDDPINPPQLNPLPRVNPPQLNPLPWVNPPQLNPLPRVNPPQLNPLPRVNPPQLNPLPRVKR